MYVEVILEYDPLCPRCTRLEPALRQLCRELSVPFIPRLASATSPVASYRQQISKTFTKEWIEKHGTPQQKRAAKKLSKALGYYAESSLAPVTIIRFHDGTTWNEIHIRGYIPGDKGNETFMKNLAVLISQLKRA